MAIQDSTPRPEHKEKDKKNVPRPQIRTLFSSSPRSIKIEYRDSVVGIECRQGVGIRV